VFEIKISLVLILLLISIFLLGCTEDIAPKNPEKISFSYSSGAMHMEWGSFEISVDSAGNGYKINKMGLYMEVKKEFSFTQEEINEVYDVAVKNNFYSLNDSYEDPFIMDGGWERLSITVDGSTKTVQSSNYNLPQVDAVSLKIYSLVDSKLGTNAISNVFRDACPEKKIECSGITEDKCALLDSSGLEFEECYACVEWSHYCE